MKSTTDSQSMKIKNKYTVVVLRLLLHLHGNTVIRSLAHTFYGKNIFHSAVYVAQQLHFLVGSLCVCVCA